LEDYDKFALYRNEEEEPLDDTKALFDLDLDPTLEYFFSNKKITSNIAPTIPIEKKEMRGVLQLQTKKKNKFIKVSYSLWNAGLHIYKDEEQSPDSHIVSLNLSEYKLSDVSKKKRYFIRTYPFPK